MIGTVKNLQVFIKVVQERFVISLLAVKDAQIFRIFGKREGFSPMKLLQSYSVLYRQLLQRCYRHNSV